MNKYLQQDTPTTETLLFKTGYIQMTESICTNIPKPYGFSSLQEEGGSEGRTREKKRTPQLFESKDLFNENESTERKMSQHISGCGKPFWGWGGGSWGQGGSSPSQAGQGEARVGVKLAPGPWFPHISIHLFYGGWGKNEDSPLGDAQVT